LRLVDETETFDGMAVARLQMDAEAAQGFRGLREQAFAARLVDGRLSGIDDGYAETLLRGCDGGGQTRGPTSDDQNVRLHSAASR
jgi:hypothetical protein